MPKNRQLIASSIGWMTIGNWADQLANFLTFIILTRLLGPEAIGLVAMAASIVILGEVLVSETLTEYLVASPAQDDESSNTVFFSLIIFAASLFVGLYLSSGIIAELYQQAIVENLIQYLGASIVILSLGAVPASLLRRDMKFKALAIRSILATLAGGLVAIWLAFNDYGVWALVMQRIVQSAVNTVLAWRAVSWRPQTPRNLYALREIIEFGLVTLALRSAHIVRIRLPMVLIGAIHGPTALGFFSLSLRLVETGTYLITGPIRKVSQSAFAARLRTNHSASELLIEFSRLSGWIAFPAMFGMMALSEPLITLIFGEQWAPASLVLPIIGFVGIYFSIELINQSYCLAMRKVGRLAGVAWLDVAIVAGAVSLPNWQSLSGSSYAFAGSFFLLWVVRFAIVSKLSAVNLTVLVRQQIMPLGASVAMALAVTYLIGILDTQTDLVKLIVGGFIGFLIYGATSLALMDDRVRLARQYF